VFNQTLAVNAYGPEGHMLAVDAFFDPKCSPYATPASIALMLKQYGSSYRQCYSWLGPNQPGVNETDPSNPGAPVPDPGGAPPGEPGPRTSASRLTAAEIQAAQATAASRPKKTKAAQTPKRPPAGSSSASSTTTTSASTSSTPATPTVPGAPPVNLKASVGQILAGTVGGGTGTSSPSGSSSPNSASPGQAQQLLNYLLAP
jgi:hypothetical protein